MSIRFIFVRNTPDWRANWSNCTQNVSVSGCVHVRLNICRNDRFVSCGRRESCGDDSGDRKTLSGSGIFSCHENGISSASTTLICHINGWSVRRMVGRTCSTDIPPSTTLGSVHLDPTVDTVNRTSFLPTYCCIALRWRQQARMHDPRPWQWVPAPCWRGCFSRCEYIHTIDDRANFL